MIAGGLQQGSLGAGPSFSHPIPVSRIGGISQSKIPTNTSSQALTDSRFSQYKLTPQATNTGMVSLGAMKNIRNDMIQAEVMKHESVSTGRIPPEEQKKYKNLRFLCTNQGLFTFPISQVVLKSLRFKIISIGFLLEQGDLLNQEEIQ